LKTLIGYFCSNFIKNSFTGLKTRKYHIFYSWILLLCFAAGQYMVYAHQHPFSGTSGHANRISQAIPHQTVKEKCDICDVLLHNAMMASYQVYLPTVNTAGHLFKNVRYSFTSIQLILAGGRAPPFKMA
jgi:hypothetical protein